MRYAAVVRRGCSAGSPMQAHFSFISISRAPTLITEFVDPGAQLLDAALDLLLFTGEASRYRRQARVRWSQPRAGSPFETRSSSWYGFRLLAGKCAEP